MKPMATSSSSSSSNKTSISPHHPIIHFTPIEEGNEDEEFSQAKSSFRETPSTDKRESDSEKNRGKGSSRKRQENTGIRCTNCRPISNREKNSAVHFMASPNDFFKSILASLPLKKSPKPSESGGSAASREEHWRIAAAELSKKLLHASRKRDEAVLEASKLKDSMAELEKKLNKLEIYCHSLKSGLEVCSSGKKADYQKLIKAGDDQEKVVENFLVMVSEARSSVRVLTRALTLQLRQTGPKVYNQISLLLQPYDVKISFTRNPRGLQCYLEALLNRALFQEFESIGFRNGDPYPILNPIDRCEANFAMFSRLRGLTWDEVLSKGTRHFSEEFSKFCDRKMSEIVDKLGWNRAWTEPVLRAFFGASKAVWLVHLLANSVHPCLPIFRVENGVGFDPVYMEDVGGDRAKKLVPSVVRIMVAPGFYVYDSVVKSKVVCRYYNNHNGGGNVDECGDKGFTPSHV